MPDVLDPVAPPAPAPDAPPAPPSLLPEIAEMMELRLGMRQPTPAPSAVQPPAPVPPTEPAPPVEPEPAPPAPANPFDQLSTTFGWNSSEDAMKEIESLRALRDNPPPPVYEFENEESKNLFQLLVKGDKKEVLKYLSQADAIEDVLASPLSAENAPQVIKLGMKLKSPTLTDTEIEYRFNKQFAPPPKPVQTDIEEDTDYQARLSQWQAAVQDRQMETMIEAKMVRPDLETKKPAFKLPQIEEDVDQGYAAYKQAVEREAKSSAEAEAAYKAMKPEQFHTKLNFKDPTNKIDFDFEFVPDPKGFEQAVAMASDINIFWKNFYNQDGSPNREKFLRSIYFMLNSDKVMVEAMKQAKNAAIKANLPKNTAPSGIARQAVEATAPPAENSLEANMARNGIRRVV